MPAVADITPVVLTFNEAPNIGRCLDRLSWAARVVVVDSGSSDETAAIVARYPFAELSVRTFDSHTAQWNHAVSLARTPWVLSLDADYILPTDFASQIEHRALAHDVVAALLPFRYCIYGRPLRASLYPPRAVLFRPDHCRYEPDGHTQRLKIDGASATVQVTIDHDDRKPVGHWLASQAKYARLEADKLAALPPEQRRPLDRVRRTIVLAPPAIAFYTLFVKGTILDGWPGWFYAGQRIAAECVLSLELLERRLRR
jgi:glycosyltransferase involved in cell wall biosynthesis